MKKISERQKLLVTDLIAEKGLNISEYALEKDYIVTDALQALFKLKDPQFDFIFCGGTCFSKAYGLLDRISEDVDIFLSLSSTTPGTLEDMYGSLYKSVMVAGYRARMQNVSIGIVVNGQHPRRLLTLPVLLRQSRF